MNEEGPLALETARLDVQQMEYHGSLERGRHPESIHERVNMSVCFMDPLDALTGNFQELLQAVLAGRKTL